MKNLPLLIGLLPVGLLLVCGIAIKYYKAYWLISGYNTMSREKKNNVDIDGLGRLMANFCFVMAGIILIAILLMSLNLISAGGMVLFLILPLSIYLIIKAQAFDGNTLKSDGTMKTRSKVLVGAMVSFLLLTSAGIGALMYFSNKPAEFIVDKGSLNISGLYGEEIMLTEISSITLREQMPEIISKNNGSSIGSRKKGFFLLKDIGQAKLFVDTQSPPFIFLEGTSGLRILNTRPPEETKKLYESLLEVWRHIQKEK